MDTEGEQLLVLAQSHKGKALEMIIEKVLTDPTIYKFSEFLDVQSVQNLGSDNKSHRSLELFAYGNYAEYKANGANYIKLNEKQLKKLKMLSVITMAGESETMGYDQISKDLDIKNKQDLEDILLELIYNRLINATLDEKNKRVHITWTFGRDIGTGSTSGEGVDEMVRKLEDWVKTMQKVENNIERHIQDLDSDLMKSKNDKRDFYQEITAKEEDKKGVFNKAKDFLGLGGKK